jgi:hypothetical protein
VAECRFVLDDRAFLVSTPAALFELGPDVEQLLESFVSLTEEDELVTVAIGWGSIHVTAELDLAGLLTSHNLVDRDVGNELLGRLSKCPVWDESPGVFVDPEVQIDGEQTESYSAAWALGQLLRPRAVGVLTLRRSPRGERAVVGVDGQALVWFVAIAADRLGFYRASFEVDDVSESQFFETATKAFPSVDFCDGVAFRRFEGAYETLRQPVVTHLSTLNDGFLEAYKTEKGNSAQISMRIGITVSIEGRTRDSEKLMKLRDAVRDGRTYRCEWHSKLKPHVNRIHFFPDLDRSRIVVGIFVDHLPT